MEGVGLDSDLVSHPLDLLEGVALSAAPLLTPENQPKEEVLISAMGSHPALDDQALWSLAL